ncbi:MAG: chemotaxis protein CheW [Chloroflexia bacterium]|nr:chemotaxis protein CheW [Chloroflexia bacterium]
MANFSERIDQLEQELAQKAPLETESDQEKLAVLTFTIQQERYAFPLDLVREVSRPQPISYLPGLHAAVLGATGLRGKVLAVLDLGHILGLSEHSPGSDSRLIVVQHEDCTAAFLIDRIQDIAHIDPAELRPAPLAPSGEKAAYLQGISGEGEEAIRLLDVAGLLGAVYADG